MTSVLFVLTNSALNRGMNTGIENLAWGIAERGVPVHILAGGVRPERHGYSLPENVSYHFTGQSGNDPASFVPIFEEIVRENRIEVTVGWIINTGLLAKSPAANDIRFIANLGQKPPRSIPLLCLKWALVRRTSVIGAYRLATSILKYPSVADAVVSISDSVQSASVEKYRLDVKKCKIIPRGIDTKSFSFVRRNRNLCSPVEVLFTGNVKDTKGVKDLVQALPTVRTPVVLRLCGRAADTYILQLKKLLKDTPHKVEYMGPVGQQELINFYHKADIFALPSHSEGLGKALIEAMLCGCPVITSDIPVFREFMQHRQNGLVVPVRAPRLLANAIQEFIDDRALREECSTNARKTVEKRFSKKMEIDEWVKLLDYEC